MPDTRMDTTKAGTNDRAGLDRRSGAASVTRAVRTKAALRGQDVGRPWTKDPEAALTRMGPDLQAIAKVMVRGNVSDSPRAVRNPTLGLFDIQKEVLQAMMGAAGLHWGGCEFGKAWSGDMMHFDLGFVPRNLK